jgi:hypothetical protein
MYQLRVPLEEFPAEYKRYTITSQASTKSLSRHDLFPSDCRMAPLPNPIKTEE